jgi:hypothetical protein
MRGPVKFVLLTAAVGVLALASTGCSLIGMGIGTLANPTALAVVLDDGTELRAKAATLDTLRTGLAGMPRTSVRTVPRGLVAPAADGGESTHVSFGALRRIEGCHGDLAFELADGTRWIGGAATLDPAAAAGDSAGSGSGELQPAPPWALRVEHKFRAESEPVFDGYSTRWQRQSHREEICLPVDRVREIRPRRTAEGTLTGLGIGALADALAVLVVALSGGILGEWNFRLGR